jgi:hypothetical protein
VSGSNAVGHGRKVGTVGVVTVVVTAAAGADIVCAASKLTGSSSAAGAAVRWVSASTVTSVP